MGLNMTTFDSDLVLRIKSAFPEERCTRSITRFDGCEGEEFDKDWFLFNGLSGLTWSEVPARWVVTARGCDRRAMSTEVAGRRFAGLLCRDT